MHCRFTQTYKSVRIIKYLHLSMLMYSVLCIRLNIYILYTCVLYTLDKGTALLYFTSFMALSLVQRHVVLTFSYR